MIDFPDSPARSETQYVIDLIFALHRPTHNASISTTDPGDIRIDGRSETWEYLHRLRSRAWRAASLDPGSIWTRQQAVTTALNDPQDYADYDPEPDAIKINEIQNAAAEGVEDEREDSSRDTLLSDFAQAIHDATWGMGDDWGFLQ